MSTTARFGTFKFIHPDLSTGPEERALFALPASKNTKHEKIQLRDYRTDPDIVKGPRGLDVQGFTVVNHTSSLTGDHWFSGTELEDVYFPEVQDLIKELTGARTILINNAAFRRKPADQQKVDPNFYKKRGQEEFDVTKMDLSKPFVTGKNLASSVEPARGIHCDYTLEGLQNTLRYSRPDITQAARNALEAIAKAEAGKPYEGPRYAAYSVWRPIKTVHRDPLAVSDWRSINPEDYVSFDYRAPTPDGEYMLNAYSIKPPKDKDLPKQRWYWVPEQQPNEVLVIKLADSESLKDGIAGSTAHGSPIVHGTEMAEPRESVEVRVMALW